MSAGGCLDEAIAQGRACDSYKRDPTGCEQCGELPLRPFLGAEHDEHIVSVNFDTGSSLGGPITGSTVSSVAPGAIAAR